MNDLLLQAESGIRATVSSFVSAWESLFGVYSPVQIRIGSYPDYTYEYYTDYGYIARVLFFIIVVFCILKMIGGIFKHGKS